MLNNDFTEMCEELELKEIIEVTFSTKDNKDFDAEYSPVYREMKSGKMKLRKHCIKIFIGGELERDIDSLIAHELIHAWQEENGIAEIHGPQFIKKARRMEKIFNLDRVYIPDVDI